MSLTNTILMGSDMIGINIQMCFLIFFPIYQVWRKFTLNDWSKCTIETYFWDTEQEV